jgi:hypothetical protein
MDAPEKVKKIYMHALNKTTELKKFVTTRINKEINNSKQERLENFSVGIVTEVNMQKLDFMTWMMEE